MENSLIDEQSTTKKATGDDLDRQTSVDSAAFYEAQDEYDDYDDFGARTGGGGGGGTSMTKTNKRQTNRGGGGGSGSIYSSKHTRMKEAQRQKQSPKKQNKR
eukprot:CAMPEP_0178896280 /NCGR_PEP_ID=MMETSP0786-20121207/1076_1 /TAXON_ID=186022 /ORGANISM="Thalassionema frauenfeldii, Strain CCMP 1798" /LENGTH=101 /DNA_ID=CAMNT_0020566647 /DNA_START=47 /DNA_END=352 /DNA_ORIENTATION=+